MSPALADGFFTTSITWGAQYLIQHLSGWCSGKEFACQCRKLILRSRICPGVGNGNPLKYSCLESSMDRVAWWATVDGVIKSSLPLSHQGSPVFYIEAAKWGTRDQIANIRWIIEKAREFQKNIYFCFTDYAKAFDCVDHNKLWKILKKMGIPDHLTCLLRNLYAGQEVTVRTGHGTTDWFQIQRVHQGCIVSPCLFNVHAEYIMRNAGLEEAQAGWNQDCWEKYQ